MTDPTAALRGATLDCRSDFPIFGHQPELVFLDSAASSQKPRAVIEAISEFYSQEYANIHRGAYQLSARATDRFEGVREQAARFFGAPALEGVIFTRNATEAVNLVAYSWGLSHLQAGDTVLVSEMEHHANLVPWHLVSRLRGARVAAVRMTRDGELDLEDYRQQLRDPSVKLVALQHVSNALGTVHPARTLVELAHARGVPILLDGAQAAPHRALDVAALGADFYVLSAHKMLGPSGVGLLIARPEALRGLLPFMGGGDMIREVYPDHSTYAGLPHTFEAGTPAIAEVMGFGAALSYLDSLGMERVWAHEQTMLASALQRLAEIPGLTLYGPPGERCGVVSFNVAGAHPHDVAGFLDESQICVRAGHHCAQPLTRALGVPSTVRASFYVYTSLADIDALAASLREIAAFFAESP